jgi:thioredoxin-like negative regulator of GroEL
MRVILCDTSAPPNGTHSTPAMLPITVSFRDNPVDMMSLAKAGCLRWSLLFLLCGVVALRGQEDAANQALDLMRANKFHEAEELWRQLEKRYPNNPAVHSNLGVTLAQQGQFEPATA